eukprot:7658403-Pyramimonas_sp.AAC.1
MARSGHVLARPDGRGRRRHFHLFRRLDQRVVARQRYELAVEAGGAEQLGREPRLRGGLWDDRACDNEYHLFLCKRYHVLPGLARTVVVSPPVEPTRLYNYTLAWNFAVVRFDGEKREWTWDTPALGRTPFAPHPSDLL